MSKRIGRKTIFDSGQRVNWGDFPIENDRFALSGFGMFRMTASEYNMDEGKELLMAILNRGDTIDPRGQPAVMIAIQHLDDLGIAGTALGLFYRACRRDVVMAVLRALELEILDLQTIRWYGTRSCTFNPSGWDPVLHAIDCDLDEVLRQVREQIPNFAADSPVPA